MNPEDCKRLICVRAPYAIYRVNVIYDVVDTGPANDADHDIEIRMLSEDGLTYTFHESDIDQSDEFMHDRPSFFFFKDITDMSDEDVFHLRLSI